jgi:hypothetical protein
MNIFVDYFIPFYHILFLFSKIIIDIYVKELPFFPQNLFCRIAIWNEFLLESVLKYYQLLDSVLQLESIIRSYLFFV